MTQIELIEHYTKRYKGIVITHGADSECAMEAFALMRMMINGLTQTPAGPIVTDF